METSFVGDFYLTGDRATMDEEGYVYFVGRSDDVIMSAGYGNVLCLVIYVVV